MFPIIHITQLIGQHPRFADIERWHMGMVVPVNPSIRPLVEDAVVQLSCKSLIDATAEVLRWIVHQRGHMVRNYNRFTLVMLRQFPKNESNAILVESSKNIGCEPVSAKTDEPEIAHVLFQLPFIGRADF